MNAILGVGGGIAAYKSAELARLLVQNGVSVQAVLTRAAQEFITPLTFATLTERKTITDLFSTDTPEATRSSAVEHISVARENDLLLVAPATANILAKFAHGLADDFLSTLYLAFAGPVMVAPAMNDQMWRHPATVTNLETLRQRGHRVMDPGDGPLACGTSGPGRMAEPQEIVSAVLGMMRTRRDFEGEVVLVTAGPTQEPIDPVRFISNRSSGKMGYALAEAAAQRGARVILISGPVSLAAPADVERISIRTASEMHDAVMEHLGAASVVIKCAAVADFRVKNPSAQKIKKTAARVSVELDPTPDILEEIGRKKQDQVLIGFAAETENLKSEAMRKLEAKNCDLVVGNLVGQQEFGFESDRNQVVLAFRTGEFVELGPASKREIADRILDEAANLRLVRAGKR